MYNVGQSKWMMCKRLELYGYCLWAGIGDLHVGKSPGYFCPPEVCTTGRMCNQSVWKYFSYLQVSYWFPWTAGLNTELFGASGFKQRQLGMICQQMSNLCWNQCSCNNLFSTGCFGGLALQGGGGEGLQKEEIKGTASSVVGSHCNNVPASA